MTNKLILCTIVFFLFGCDFQKPDELQPLINHSESQFKYALQNINPLLTNDIFSPRTFENGVLKLVPAKDWTSGFFAGNLWMM